MLQLSVHLFFFDSFDTSHKVTLSFCFSVLRETGSFATHPLYMVVRILLQWLMVVILPDALSLTCLLLEWNLTANVNGRDGVQTGAKDQEPSSISAGNFSKCHLFHSISFVVRVLAKLLQMALAFLFCW
jgi:hypothetical protein